MFVSADQPTDHVHSRIISGSRYFAALVAPIYLLAMLAWPTTADADVKVRSYYKGKKTEGSIKSKKPGSRSKSPDGPATKQKMKGRENGIDPDDDFEAGEILIANPPRNFDKRISEMGFSVLERVQMEDIGFDVWRLKTPAGMSVKDAIKVLGRKFPGLTIDANHRFDLSAGKSGLFPQKAIGWKKVGLRCGKGVRIGMIDSGVDVKHPALKGQKVKFASFHDKKRNPAPPVHGTAIAAMLVGKPMKNGWSGLLPGATLYAANMFELDNSDKVVGNSVALLKGINWMAKKKVHVVNLSIAGADNKMLRLANKLAQKKGLILVASVGNWGSRKKPAYPAAYPNVVAVTATNVKKKIYSKANQGKYVDFSAPGVGVWTAIPGGGKVQSGTSFATPYMSILIGLDIARGASKNAKSLRAKYRNKVIDLGKIGRDPVFGWGLLKTTRKCMA